MPLHGFLPQFDKRLPRDLGRHERVAVAVAADPGGEPQHPRDAEGIIMIIATQGPAQIAVQPGHNLPERLHDHHVAADFLEHGRPPRANGIGFPQAAQVRFQTRQQRPALGPREIRPVQVSQSLAKAAQGLANRRPLGLGRMRGKDRRDLQQIEERLHAVRLPAHRLQRVDCRAHRFVAWQRVALGLPGAEHPKSLPVFGKVDQVEVAALHADDLVQVVQTHGGHFRGQGVARGRIARPATPGQFPHAA